MTTPAMVVLRPGDKVLVTLNDEPSLEDAQMVLSDLRKSFPGVEFTLLAGISSLAVAAPE